MNEIRLNKWSSLMITFSFWQNDKRWIHGTQKKKTTNEFDGFGPANSFIEKIEIIGK